MALKLCLSCKKQVGAKIKICSCGYDFIEKKLKKIKSTVVLEEYPKLYYGQKTRTRIPSGLPPLSPKGFIKNWTKGEASEKTIQDWAIEVFNSQNGSLEIDGVIYWARYFWDITDPSFDCIIDLITKALTPLDIQNNSSQK
jgi:hypothetical protein